MKALVVDDSYGCRSLIEAILQRMGHSVDMAGNGRDGVLKYVKAAEEGEPYDFVTMDNVMPIMDGIQAARSIRTYETNHAELKRAYLCFVTSDIACHNCFLQNYTLDSLTGFIQKPMDILCFISVVRDASER